MDLIVQIDYYFIKFSYFNQCHITRSGIERRKKKENIRTTYFIHIFPATYFGP